MLSQQTKGPEIPQKSRQLQIYAESGGTVIACWLLPKCFGSVTPLTGSVPQAVGGSGGGRPDMAQAGGTDVSKLDQAVAALYKSLESEQLSLV